MSKNKTTKPAPLSLEIGEEIFEISSPSVETLFELLDFKVKVDEGKLDMETREGLEEYMRFLVILFDNPKLSFEKLIKVKIPELMQSMELGKIENWITQFFTPSEDGSDNGPASKKE